MSDKPAPTKWPSAFLGACLSILFGSIALYLAVQLIERIAVALVIGGLVAVAGWLVWWWHRHPTSEW
jgi:uncharacterized BrkB/YihY/UPF0761 family membrane protein